MTEQQSARFKAWQWRTILGTMIGYAIFYFVRKNFSFAMPGLSAEYGISNTDFGTILTLVGLIYGLSRFANGFIADRLNGRWHMAAGLLMCAAANFAFGCGADICEWITGVSSGTQFVNALVLFFGIMMVLNNIFQGSGFPPVTRLLTRWVPPQELATKMSIWNTSHSIGAGLLAILCGYIMGSKGRDLSGDADVVASIAGNLGLAPDSEQVIAAAQHFGAWQWCFWIPAMIALGGVVFLIVTLRDTPSSVGLPELEGSKTALDDNSDSDEYKQFIRRMVFRNPVIYILAAANFFVYVVRFTVLDWGPTFLQKARGFTSAESGFTVATFEIVGIIGMLAAGWATDKLLQGRAHRTCVFCMIGSAVSVGLFTLLPEDTNHYVQIMVLATVGFFIYGPQALIGIAAANQATKSAASTANGFIGMFGYASTFVSGLGFGIIVDNFGWDSVFRLMVLVSLVGMGVLMLMWRAAGDGYARQK